MNNLSQTIRVDDLALVVHEGAPLIRDADLGQKLGMSRPRDIRKLIERYKHEFPEIHCRATVARQLVNGGAEREYTVNEFWLNEEQSLFFASKSDTPAGGQILRAIINVFISARKGLLAPSQMALPLDVAHGPRVRDVPEAAEDMKAWLDAVGVRCGVTSQRAQGFLRKRFRVPSVYDISLMLWPTAKGILQDLTLGKLLFPSKKRVVQVDPRQMKLFN